MTHPVIYNNKRIYVHVALEHICPRIRVARDGAKNLTLEKYDSIEIVLKSVIIIKFEKTPKYAKSVF